MFKLIQKNYIFSRRALQCHDNKQWQVYLLKFEAADYLCKYFLKKYIKILSGRNPTWRHQRQPLSHFVGLKCYRGRLEAHRGFRSPANPKPRRAERNGGCCRHPRRPSVMPPPRPLHASSSFPLPRRHPTPFPHHYRRLRLYLRPPTIGNGPRPRPGCKVGNRPKS